MRAATEPAAEVDDMTACRASGVSRSSLCWERKPKEGDQVASASAGPIAAPPHRRRAQNHPGDAQLGPLCRFFARGSLRNAAGRTRTKAGSLNERSSIGRVASVRVFCAVLTLHLPYP